MAKLPEGFTQFSSNGVYENSAKAPDVSVGRGPPPKHNADGYKPMAIGTYTDGLSDATKGSEEPVGEKETMMDVTEPAQYSRDWSGKK